MTMMRIFAHSRGMRLHWFRRHLRLHLAVQHRRGAERQLQVPILEDLFSLIDPFHRALRVLDQVHLLLVAHLLVHHHAPSPQGLLLIHRCSRPARWVAREKEPPLNRTGAARPFGQAGVASALIPLPAKNRA